MQGLLIGVPAEVAAAAEVPATILQAFAQRRASSAAAHAPLPTVPPPASAPACRGLSGAGAAAAHAASLPAKPTKPLHAKPTKPTTSSRAAKEAAESQAARRRSMRLAESQQQQEEGSLVARISPGPSPGPSRDGRSADGRTVQRSAAKADPAAASRAAGQHSASQVGSHLAVCMKWFLCLPNFSAPLPPPSAHNAALVSGPNCRWPRVRLWQRLQRPPLPALAASGSGQARPRLWGQRPSASSSISSWWPNGSGGHLGRQ